MIFLEILKIIATALFSVVTMFIIAKLIGRKQISQLEFFDYINGITIGSIAAELATELENPLRPFIAMAVYGVIAVVLNFITNKVPPARKIINGEPIIIMNGGIIYKQNLKKGKLDLNEFLCLCRQEGYFNINDIQTAVFEYNGKLTVLPKAAKRPVNPTDINIFPPTETINTEIIMDGKVMTANLKRLGLSYEWLQKELKCQGYKNTKDILLGICDSNNQVTFFKN